MRLVDVARAVLGRGDEHGVIVSAWTGQELTWSAQVHADRAKYRGMMVPRCAKRAVLFLAARIVEQARDTGTVIVAGHADGGIVAALAAECARNELAFDACTRARRARVRSVSFGAHMRYPTRADVRVVCTRDTRALYPCGGSGRFWFVGDRDAAFYARMAMAVLGPFGKRAHVSMEQYAAAAEPEPPVEAPPVEAPPVEAPPVEAPESVVDVEAPTVADTAEAPSVAAPKDEEETEWGPVLEWVVVR
jgi:hypothetical protein